MSVAISPVSTAAADRLRLDREAVARSVTAALYAERPTLLDAYGERGREKTLLDMLHNVDHLVAAVEFGDPVMFARYIRWVDDVLLARGVPTTHLVRALELLAAETDRYPAAEASEVRPHVDAAIHALERP